MFIVAQHHILDGPRFWRTVHAAAFCIPEGLALYSLLPSRSGEAAVSLWKAESIEPVQFFVELLVGDVSETTYYEVDPYFALLPSSSAYDALPERAACLHAPPEAGRKGHRRNHLFR